jgi:hypothetical protein
MLALPTAFLATSCEDLEVENLNAAQIADVLANPGDFPGLIDGAYLTWWQGIQLNVPNMPVSVGAQGLSSSWGNWGMQDLGTIPRLPIQNTLTYNNRAFITTPWYNLNNALSQVNEVGRVLNDVFGGRAIDPVTGADVTQQVVANMKVVQGLTMGWLGLIFDQAFIADETVAAPDLARLPLRPYRDVVNAAATKLEEAAAMFAANPNIVIRGISGYQMSGDQARRFCNSMAAKMLAYAARDAAEAQSQTNWARVLQLQNNGLNFDFSPFGDGNFWWTRILIQGQTPLWGRVSHRIIAMSEGANAGPTFNQADIDPNHPTAPYPWPGSLVGDTRTPVNLIPRINPPRDRRLETDFRYIGNNDFQAARGRYFFSSYAMNKYAYYLVDFLGPMPHMTKFESDLLRAEALIRTGGSKTVAADLINQTRVGRGQLAPVTGAMSDAQLLDAISYERIIEFGWDGALNSWFHRRIAANRQFQLHEGTARHLPIPAAELEVLGIPNYTFGGDTER